MVSRKKFFNYFFFWNNFGERALAIKINEGLTYSKYFQHSKKLFNSYFNLMNEIKPNCDENDKWISFNNVGVEIVYHAELQNNDECKILIDKINKITTKYYNYIKRLKKINKCNKDILLLNKLAKKHTTLKQCSVKQLKSDINNKYNQALKYIEKSNIKIENLEDIPKLIYEDTKCLLRDQYCINLHTIMEQQQINETRLWEEFQTLIEMQET